MDNSRLTLVISIIFFTFPYPASPSGFLEVRLLHFSNPEGKAANGECCDQTGYWFKSCEPCDHMFVICIDDTADSSSFRSCRMGRFQTGRIKSNVITFNNSLGDGLKNPLRFKFKTWPGIVKLKVAVLDYDDVNVRERIDHFEYQFRSSGRREKKYSLTRMLNLTGSISSISLQLKVYCDTHYYGPNCNTFCIKTDSRTGHYTCGKKTGRKICNLGWMGKDCLQNQDDCLYNRCHKDAKCIDGLAFYKCQCPAGRTGILCDVDTNECVSNPCLHGGTCQDRLNSFQCICHKGFTGTTCETQMLPCESNPCLNGATCVHKSSSFICRCTELFEGKRCEVRKQYKHVCDQYPCRNGKCIPGSHPALYTCRCLPGYTGKHCGIKINGCLSSPCHNEATCINGVNVFYCICKPGYIGTLCENRHYSCESNPCLNGGVCIDGIAHFFCRCGEHFEGEHCEIDTRLADPCQSSPCQNGGHCKVDENGSDFTCVCEPQNTGTRCEIILSTESLDKYSTAKEDPTFFNVHSTAGSSVPGWDFAQVTNDITSIEYDRDLLKSVDSSLEEISTSQTTTLRTTEYSTDRPQSFTGEFGTLSTEEEFLLDIMPETETQRTMDFLTDSEITPSSFVGLFSEGNALQSPTAITASETTKPPESSLDEDELLVSDTPLSEAITEVTQEVFLTSRSKRTPKKELFSSDTPLNEIVTEVTPDIFLTSRSKRTSETKKELISSVLHALISEDRPLSEVVTEVTPDISLTSRYKRTLKSKKEPFSVSSQELISGNMTLREDTIEVTTEISPTNGSTSTSKTNEELISSDFHKLLTDDNLLARGVTGITPDILFSSGISPETDDELVSSGLRVSVSDDTLTENDASDVTRNISITNRYTHRAKGEFFITSTTAPTKSVSTDFETRQYENFTNSLEGILSAQSPSTEATTDETSSVISETKSDLSLTTVTFPISTTDELSLVKNKGTLIPLQTGSTDNDGQTAYYPDKSVARTDVAMAQSNTFKFTEGDFTSATEKSKTDFVATDKTPNRMRSTGIIPSTNSEDKQLSTLTLLETSTKSPARQTFLPKIPTKQTKISAERNTTRKTPTRRRITQKIPLRWRTTTKVPARKPPTRKIPLRRTTTMKIPLRRTTTTRVPTRKSASRKIPGKRKTTTENPLRRTTTMKIPLRRTTTTRVPARKSPTRKIPGKRKTTIENPLRRTTITKVSARKPLTRKIPGRRTRKKNKSKTRKSRTKTTTIMTTTWRPVSPEICILVQIRPTSKVPKQIGPTEAPRNGTPREEYNNPDTTRRLCWALKHEKDFVFPAPQAEKPVALDLVTPFNWVNQLLLSMIPNDDYTLLIKDAVMNWVRESLSIFLRNRRTDIPRHISVFNSTCVVIVIKPKRIGGAAARTTTANKPPESLKMFVCRSAVTTTTLAPTTKVRHGLILKIKVQNETHEEKKTIYPGTPERPTVIIRVVTTTRKAVEYGKEVAKKAFRKTKLLLHNTLRKLSGVWKDVKLISEKLTGPVAASREAIRRVWNDAWQNTQKAYERTQQLVRQAYQKARETFTRYIDNIKVTGREAYIRTYKTYLNYYNDYTKKVRKTAEVFRKNYDRYTDYLRNYWKELGN